MDLMSLKNMTIEYNQEIKNNEGGRKEEKKEGEKEGGTINKIKGKINSTNVYCAQVAGKTETSQFPFLPSRSSHSSGPAR